MKKVMLMLCVLAAACDGVTVPERAVFDIYDFRLPTTGRPTLRWESGSTVKLYVTPDADATRTTYLRDATAHSVQAWNPALLFGQVKLAQTERVEDADVVIQYTPATSPVELVDCPPGGGAAFTTFCLTEDNAHLTAFPLTNGGTSRVKFVVTVRATSITDAASVRRFVTHEIGHVLGIALHSPRPNDLMFGGTLNRDIPSAADRATLQVLYDTAPDVTP